MNDHTQHTLDALFTSSRETLTTATERRLLDLLSRCTDILDAQPAVTRRIADVIDDGYPDAGDVCITDLLDVVDAAQKWVEARS